MSVIVEFTLASSAFPFGRSMSGGSGMKASLDRISPLDEGRLPFVWVTDHDLEAYERQLESSDIVASVEMLTRLEDSALYRVEWNTEGETFLNGVAQTGGTIVEGNGDDESWSFSLRFRNHAALTNFHRFYQNQDFPVHIDRVYAVEEKAERESAFGLTAKQREALAKAVDHGYFSVPRGTQLEEMADEMGISRQALSEHIRRGAEKVLRMSVLDAGDGVAGTSSDRTD